LGRQLDCKVHGNSGAENSGEEGGNGAGFLEGKPGPPGMGFEKGSIEERGESGVGGGRYLTALAWKKGKRW